jgi:hypothetical protein
MTLPLSMATEDSKYMNLFYLSRLGLLFFFESNADLTLD